MRVPLRHFWWMILFAVAAGVTGRAQSREDPRPLSEGDDYEHLPMPPGFQVRISELEGPVFADAKGSTLYRWPPRDLRNGTAGEQRGQPTCDNRIFTENSGLMSPYPAGLLLPELDKRPSCAQIWPPALAQDDSKPVGKWTIVKRPDGSRQWAYDGYALYTSVLDHQPGDAFGGTKLRIKVDYPAFREPVGPPPNIPPDFNIARVATGRLLVMFTGFSVYSYDKDEPNRSNCDSLCLKDHTPVRAPELARSRGEWSIIERSPGVKQWSFRGMPLYTYDADQRLYGYEGSNVSGWHNVYVQNAPRPPREFTLQETRSGEVLADARGMTIYIYHCGDDALDQLACDHPESTQAYRLAICGGGDPVKCLRTFPYVPAGSDEKSGNRTWGTLDIDPLTGHLANPGQPGSVRVWAYRDRPVYTFAGDRRPGDIGADAWGEFEGGRNGFKAFWVRDAFRDNDK